MFGLHKQVSSATAVTFTFAAGDEFSSRTSIQRRLSDIMSVDVNLNAAFAGGFIRPGVSVFFNRAIWSGITAKVGAEVGLRQAVSFGLVSRDDSSVVGATVTLSKNNVAVQAKYTHRFDEQTKIKVRLGTASIAAGSTHSISPKSQISSLIELNFQTGVILYFNWKHLGHSFDVPIIINMQPSLLTTLLGSIVPTAFAFAVRNLIIEPRRRRSKQQ